nr:hypothetical protein [Paenibacillus xylanexedens]
MPKAIVITFLSILIFLTACSNDSLPKDEPSISEIEPNHDAATDITITQDAVTKSSSNIDFEAGLTIDLESAKDLLKKNERPALSVLEKNLTALVQHDHKMYRSGFVDDRLADAMEFYYGEHFQYKFSSIESITSDHPASSVQTNAPQQNCILL